MDCSSSSSSSSYDDDLDDVHDDVYFCEDNLITKQKHTKKSKTNKSSHLKKGKKLKKKSKHSKRYFTSESSVSSSESEMESVQKKNSVDEEKSSLKESAQQNPTIVPESNQPFVDDVVDFCDTNLISQQKHKKSKSKKARHEKRKRPLKKKSKHHKRCSTSESSDSSAESVTEWVERKNSTEEENSSLEDRAQQNPTIVLESKTPFVKPSETNDWSDFSSFIPTYSNDGKKKLQTKKEWNAIRHSAIPGHHSRELNPYWKDGGDGLPTEMAEPSKVAHSSQSHAIGDGGLHWLRAAYQRAKEQAREEGRSLEHVAAERWGSLSNFYTMLQEAENKATGKTPGEVDEGIFDKASRRKDHSRSHVASTRFHQRQPTWMKPSSSAGSTESGSTFLKLPSPSSGKEKSRSPVPVDMTGAETQKPKIVTDQEMNALSAKILKAEMLGKTSLVAELKAQHTEAENARQKFIKDGGDPQKQDEKKIVTKIVMGSENHGRKKGNRPTETHKDGQRVRYFPDDDKQSLKNMFQREKMSKAEDENALFSRLAGKVNSKQTDDYDLDDVFTDKASSSKKVEKEKEREVRRLIDEEKVYNKTLDECEWCFDGRKLEKNIVISMGEKSFICVPPFQSLSDGHCLIVPMFHASASTEVDEDVWNEMKKFRHSLVTMFKDQEQDVIIFETAIFLKRLPHMYWECVPMPKKTGELAPIYFKKAIQECETEWSQNKKLVDLRGRDVRRGVPKGLPYFSVDFGNDSGFAHVIEDERNFPRNFAQEIIGGMLELDHSVWRKRKHDNFKEQREKVMKFLKLWAPYDWTRDG